MSRQTDNPIQNVIELQIKGGIQLCYDHEHASSALKLIYSGIDFMAFLSMPAHKKSVTKFYFEKWANDYIEIPGKNPPTGAELRRARDELLHAHRAHEAVKAKNRLRPIVYAYKKEDEILELPLKQGPIVMLPVESIIDAFFKGIDKFLTHVNEDPKRKETVERRLRTTFHYFKDPRRISESLDND